MAQILVINGNSIVLNDETLFTTNLANSFAVSNDLQTVYVASAYNLRKYVKNYNIKTGEFIWDTDNTFSFVLNNKSQFISGLFLDDDVLYVSTGNSQNKSTILKVNAKSGIQFVDLDTGVNQSLFYYNDTASLTEMTIGDGKYLYALNTGNYNSGRSIDRISLKTGFVNTKAWIDNLVLAPIQCCIYNNYLCVLEADIFSGKRLIEIFNLKDGNRVHTVELKDSDFKPLGLSLINSLLRLINNNSKILYKIDLDEIDIDGTTVLPAPTVA
jgi:hypothetical protein